LGAFNQGVKGYQLYVIAISRVWHYNVYKDRISFAKNSRIIGEMI
jgi:hypothetical protein